MENQTPTQQPGNGERGGATPIRPGPSEIAVIAAEIENLAGVAGMLADRIAGTDRAAEGAANTLAAQLDAVSDRLSALDVEPARGGAA